jgi:hypothetical protein
MAILLERQPILLEPTLAAVNAEIDLGLHKKSIMTLESDYQIGYRECKVEAPTVSVKDRAVMPNVQTKSIAIPSVQFQDPKEQDSRRLEAANQKLMGIITDLPPVAFKFFASEEKKTAASVPVPARETRKFKSTLSQELNSEEAEITAALEKHDITEAEKKLYRSILKKYACFKISQREGVVLEANTTFPFEEHELIIWPSAMPMYAGQ